jgi:MFS family permease
MLGYGEKRYYGWVIVTAFFVIGTIMYGVLFSFGAFFKPISSEFNLARAAASSIFSIQNVFGSAFAFIGGWAVDRYGPRTTGLFIGLLAGLSLLLTSQTNTLWQLYITYGLLFSVIGALFTVIMSTVSKWFDKNRGLALGIAGSGEGLGLVVIVPFAAYLITSFDWHMAYVILGLIAWFLIMPLSALLRRSPAEIIVQSPGTTAGSGETGIALPKIGIGNQITELSLRAAGRTRSFWLFAIARLLYSFCYMLVMIHLVPHATDIGVPPMQAATIIGVIGASSVIGRLIIGKASDIFGRKSFAVACSLFMAAAMLWLIWVSELSMLYVFAVVFGLFRGGADTLFLALIGDAFGIRHLGRIMGTLGVAFGVGTIIGPALGGYIFDITESYVIAFLLAALAMLVSSLLTSLTKREIS